MLTQPVPSRKTEFDLHILHIRHRNITNTLKLLKYHLRLHI